MGRDTNGYETGWRGCDVQTFAHLPPADALQFIAMRDGWANMRVCPMGVVRSVFAMFARVGPYSSIASATSSFEYLKNTQVRT